MKIGDKVRFLSAVGGGIVKGFQGKDIALVEEEDGFETPVLVRECVVIENNEAQLRNTPPPPVAASPQKTPSSTPPAPEKATAAEYTFEELAGKDRINLYIAYLPENIKNLTNGCYEAYLVNDSNYFLFCNYMSRDNNTWKSIYHGLIEPNTRLFIHEFTKEQLNDLERVCVQCIAFKKDKPYSLKNSYSVELRIDTVKFYKIHCFRKNDFFEDEAIVYPVIVNDVPEREMLISTAELQESMMQKKQEDRRRPRIIEKKPQNTIEEVDLHINQLLDSTAGMSNAEILEFQLSKFRQTLENFKHKKGQKIVFIHGKGDGVLRNAVLSELKTKYRAYSYQDASFKEYGFGATLVTVS